jgi:hypothetical protein
MSASKSLPVYLKLAKRIEDSGSYAMESVYRIAVSKVDVVGRKDAKTGYMNVQWRTRRPSELLQAGGENAHIHAVSSWLYAGSLVRRKSRATARDQTRARVLLFQVVPIAIVE